MNNGLPPLPLVSVLIPAYNAEKYISEALDSILDQTYPNLEVIVVNDGSTDRTASILAAYLEKGIKIISQPNRGQCSASNRAFLESKGKLIKFFDADDLLNAENIELQVKKLGGAYDYVASSEWGRFWNDDRSTFKLNEETVWRDMAPVDWLVESWSKGLNMMQCALWLIPRKILDKSGLWDERLSLNNDIDFFARVLLASKGVRFTPGARLYYRSGISGSLSNIMSSKSLEAAVLSNRLAVGHLLAFENSPRTRQACANILQVWAYNSFPDYKDITFSLEDEIKGLGGSTYTLPGGRVMKMLCKLLGWKRAKQIHRLLAA